MRQIFAALLLPVCALALTTCGKSNDTTVNHAAVPGVKETDTDRAEQIRSAFEEPNSEKSADVATVSDVQEFFNALSSAVRLKNHPKIVSSLDFNAMMSAAEHLGTALPKDSAGREKFASGLRKGIEDSIKRPVGSIFEWQTARVVRVQLSGDGKACLTYVRHELDDEGTIGKLRWWLCRHGETWKIYDWESFDTGIRVSRVFGLLLPGGTRVMQKWALDMPVLAEARATVLEGRSRDALKMLDAIKDSDFPTDIEAVRTCLVATCLFNEGDHVAALSMARRAMELKADFPEARYLRGKIQFELKKYGAAASDFEWYLQTLGSDPVVFIELGNALTWLGRHADAEKHYRSSLADVPLPGAISSLALCLNGKDYSELAAFFLKLRNPTREYSELAGELWFDHELPDAVRAINDAYRTLAPQDVDLAYYTAEVALHDDKPALAASTVKPFLEKAREDERKAYKELYWRAMVEDGKSLEALREHPGADAFAFIAALVFDNRKADELDKLCEAFRAGNEKDLKLHFYLGEADYIREDYAAAEKHFAEGHALGPKEAKEISWLRTGWADSLYRQNQALKAYETVPPARATFEQLAAYATDEEQTETLKLLVEAHVKADPKDPELGRFQGELAWLSKDWKQAAAQFSQYIKGLDKDAYLPDGILEKVMRASVRIGDHKGAESWRARQLDNPDWYTLAAIYAATGNAFEVKSCLMSLERRFKDAGNEAGFAKAVQDLYNDTDGGSALRGPKHAELHKRFPPAAKPVGSSAPKE